VKNLFAGGFKPARQGVLGRGFHKKKPGGGSVRERGPKEGGKAGPGFSIGEEFDRGGGPWQKPLAGRAGAGGLGTARGPAVSKAGRKAGSKGFDGFKDPRLGGNFFFFCRKPQRAGRH